MRKRAKLNDDDFETLVEAAYWDFIGKLEDEWPTIESWDDAVSELYASIDDCTWVVTGFNVLPDADRFDLFDTIWAMFEIEGLTKKWAKRASVRKRSHSKVSAQYENYEDELDGTLAGIGFKRIDGDDNYVAIWKHIGSGAELGWFTLQGQNYFCWWDSDGVSCDFYDIDDCIADMEADLGTKFASVRKTSRRTRRYEA